MKVSVNGVCPKCLKDWTVVVDFKNYAAFKKGNLLAQEAFPELSASERELLITGICEKCWNDIFPPEDEEDEYIPEDLIADYTDATGLEV